jgi:hypothetical protein
MKVVANGSGKFRVATADGAVLADDLSNSDAWRFIDRHEGDPINHAQRESEWFWNKISVGKHFDGGFHEDRPGIPHRDQNGNLIVPEKKSTNE